MVSVQAIAVRASSYDPVRFVLAALALPFYVLGCVAAVVWLAGSWLVAAARTGFDDARERAVGAADRGET